MSSKKKKRARKGNATTMSKEVKRPSHKKPRAKKYVEPKLPKLGLVPEGVDVPKEPEKVKPDISSSVDKAGRVKIMGSLLNSGSLTDALKQLEDYADKVIAGQKWESMEDAGFEIDRVDGSITAGDVEGNGDLNKLDIETSIGKWKRVDQLTEAFNKLPKSATVDEMLKAIDSVPPCPALDLPRSPIVVEASPPSKPIKTGGVYSREAGLGRGRIVLTDEEITHKIKTGDVAVRPKLDTLREKYEEYRAGGVKGPNPPRPQAPAITVQVDLPPGYTEESVASIVNKVVTKLKAEHQGKIDEIAAMYGDAYKTKGFAALTPDEKNIPVMEAKLYGAKLEQSPTRLPPVEVPEMRKLTWFERFLNWMSK